MTTITKKQIIEEFKNAKNDDLFCVSCYKKLKKIKNPYGEVLQCPNEHCDNHRYYSLKGVEQ